MNLYVAFSTKLPVGILFMVAALFLNACHRSGPVYSTVKNNQKIDREIKVTTSAKAVYGRKPKTPASNFPSQMAEKPSSTPSPSTSQRPSSYGTHTRTSKKQAESQPSVSHSEVLAQEQRVILEKARSFMGTRHRIGGMDKNGIDCSGLMVVSFREIGIELPRTSREQSELGKEVSRNQLKPCDLVFFSNTGSGRITHVGMISEVTHNQVMFIHTSTSGGVKEESLFSDYWNTNFVKAKRMF